MRPPANVSEVSFTGRLIVGTLEWSAKAAADGVRLTYVERREAQPFLDAGSLVQVWVTGDRHFKARRSTVRASDCCPPLSGPSSTMSETGRKRAFETLGKRRFEGTAP